MSGSEPDDEEIQEISEVYDILRRDAKLLLTDFKEGVSMWNTTSILMLYLAVLGIFLASAAAFPRILVAPNPLVTIIAFGALGIASAIGSILTRHKYRKLKTKYTKLFEIASRLK